MRLPLGKPVAALAGWLARGGLAATLACAASACAPAPIQVQCDAPAAVQGADCMSWCLECGFEDYGPCRAKCSQTDGPTPGGLNPVATAGGSVCDGGPCAADGGVASVLEAGAPGSGGGNGGAVRFPGSQFPPADFEPPHSRSAKAGDGLWRRLGAAAAGDRAAEGRAALYVTSVHPHPVSRFEEVIVAAMDLRHLAVHFLPGKDDPGVAELEPSPGLVPAGQQGQLLVAFNGGFLPRHGRWGMMVQGKELVAPRPDGCTIGLYRDGAIRIRPWSELQATVSDMVAYRQTPPCMLDAGKLHPQLEGHNERPWGGRDPNRKTRRRSALAITADGRTLLYGMGTEVGPEMLTRALSYAGASDVVQLDINWSWTRFLLYGRQAPGDPLRVTSTLIPKMTHGRHAYLKRPGHRDFFYVLSRQE
ncbi:MAG: hypothetical protein JRI68_04090 [Deltaproteobacteria bacterium]|nr:hypothetical protein [Deltaproteobacteria bacterium]